MLKFYSGNHIGQLADRLIEVLRSEPLEDPLAAEVFVVQNHGMARWLATTTATKNGIAANQQFKFPAEKVWDFYRSMDSEIPAELPSDREPLTWKLFELLEELPEESPYHSVWHYMRDEDGTWNSLKAWKLAGEIGDIFDKYLNYRPEMLLNWESGKTAGLGAPEAWQSDLWRRLVDVWKASDPVGKWIHQAQIHRAFMEQLKRGVISPESLPERVILFGLSGLPPSSIELFVNISRLIEVHWFRPDPSGKNEDHPLIQSWGGEGREFSELFKHYTETGNISVEMVTLPDHREDQKETVSGLPSPVSEIQIHSCHSPQREVEVLHDRLLDQFNSSPDLLPDDILILTPDIETYAPFIEAGFGTTEEGLPDLPFHVINERRGLRKEAFQTFTKLLKILDSRFKVAEVLDLLSSGVVMDKFDISEDELEQLTRWIDETKIRWGIDGNHKQQMDLPGSQTFTWQFGVDRMILGFACRQEDELFQGIYPYDQVESSDDAALVGKIARFLNELKEAHAQSRKPRSITDWERVLLQWISEFIPAGKNYHHAYQGLTRLVEGPAESATLGGFNGLIRFPVLLDYLEEKLTAEAARGGYYGHGITFSGLDQMRNIPYTIIGMIGMNSDAFPRRRIDPDFDLMARNPKPGDRIQRSDDRYLFLETLQSVEKLLYLSYVGQSDRDDSIRPPSVLISEMVDCLAEKQGVKTRESELVQEHPLHGFSSRYFSKDEKNLYSYSSIRYEVSQKIKSTDKVNRVFWDGPLPEADEVFRQLSFNDLVRFFENPSRYLLQRRLGLYFREEDVISEEQEPFELKGLDRYKLGEELVMRRLNNQDVDLFETIARAKGYLPDGWIGEKAFREKKDEVEEFSSAVGRIMELSRRESEEVRVELDDFLLTGIVDNIYESIQLFIRYGSMRAKDLIKLWINHLALQKVPELDDVITSLLITYDHNKPSRYMFSKISNPDQCLKTLLDIYWEGMHSKIPFFAGTSFSYAHEICVRNKDHEGAMKSASRQWKNDWKPHLGESEDPYIKILFKDDEPVGGQKFIDLSLKVWEPVFNVLNQEEERFA